MELSEVPNEQRVSLWPWVRARALKWLLWSAAVMLATYLSFAIPFWTRSPSITKRFVSDFNKEIAAIPEVEKAWPLLRRAAIATSDWNREEFPNGPPESTARGDPQFAACRAHLESWKDSIEQLRESSTKAHLGHFVGTSDDNLYDVAIPIEERLRANDAVDLERDPLLFSILQQWIGVMRLFTRTLALDMDVAAAENEPERVVNDVRALCLLSDLAPQPPNVIGQLVGDAMRVYAAKRLSRQIAQYPGLFSIGQLDQLASALASVANRHSKIDLEWERRTVEDFAQRIFSDDGQGDGLMTMDGWDLVAVMGGQKWSREKAVFVGPLVARAWGTRSQFNVFVVKAFQAAADEIAKPSWERSQTWIKELETEAQRDEAPRSFFLVLAIVSTTPKALAGHALTLAEIEAAIAAIAAEKFRLERGRFPKTIEEMRSALNGKLPTDPFTGDPLRFRLVGEVTPVVYSTGADRVDNGGDPTADPEAARKWLNAEDLLHLSKQERDAINGDWVLWPPATVEWADRSEHPLQPHLAE